MLKINLLVHLYNLDDDKNNDSVDNDREDNEFVNFVEKLFVWGLEEVINIEKYNARVKLSVVFIPLWILEKQANKISRFLNSRSLLM